MHIKICGLTTADDALAAVEAGADYLGFNFYPKSPRRVTPETCARIHAALRAHGAAVTTVGIFVNETPAEVAVLLDYCGLDLAQLHGEEQPEHLVLLWGRAFKSLRGAEAATARLDELTCFSPGAPAFLLDAHVPGQYGGTGRTTDWALAARLAERYPLFLAGGLTPDNVAEAVARVRPWGVDVASGVEAVPGRKDVAKVRAFIDNARHGQGKAGNSVEPGYHAAVERGKEGKAENKATSP